MATNLSHTYYAVCNTRLLTQPHTNLAFNFTHKEILKYFNDSGHLYIFKTIEDAVIFVKTFQQISEISYMQSSCFKKIDRISGYLPIFTIDSNEKIIFNKELDKVNPETRYLSLGTFENFNANDNLTTAEKQIPLKIISHEPTLKVINYTINPNGIPDEESKPFDLTGLQEPSSTLSCKIM